MDEDVVMVVPPNPHTLVIEYIDFRIDELRQSRFNLRKTRDELANLQMLQHDVHGPIARQDQRIKQVDDLIAHFKDSRAVLQRAQHPSVALDTRTHQV